MVTHTPMIVMVHMGQDDFEAIHDYVQNISTKHYNNLKLIHMNAQSILDDSKQAEFIDIFSYSGIDIIIVSETWLKNDMEIILPGFKSFYMNRNKEKRGGGVAVFIKSCYPAKVIATSQGDIDKPEYLMLEALVGSDKILIAGIYRPPKIGYLNAFQDDIYHYSVNYKYTFVGGDINARFGSGSDETKIISDSLSLCNLTSVPYQATFHAKGCDSNLDVICSNCPENLIDFGQRSAPGFSAHDIIYAVYDLSVSKDTPKPIYYRDLKHVNSEKLLNDVENVNWWLVYDKPDVDSKLETFNNLMIELMDKHAPLKIFVPTKSSQPWMSKYIKSLMRNRDKLWKKQRSTGCALDNENYRVARNKVKQEIRNAKCRFFHDKFKLSSDTKSVWSTVRSLGIKSTSSQSEPVVPVDALNKHYASVSSVRYPMEISMLIEDCKKNTTDRDINDKFHFNYVLPEDIVNAVTSIKSNAKGFDNIPVSFIKLCLSALLPVLDHLFNFSLQNGIFPTLWKMANILPIVKVKNPKEAKDYRPISILCVLGKALEKIVHKQVSDYLSNNQLFAEYQSGFRKNHSTVTALLKVTDDIRAAMDQRLMTLLVLLDLSKAFDCVHHELLLTKLKYLGFSDNTLNWFLSYLSHRCHRVLVNEDLYSSWENITTGVPQGSVLGPLLFIIYMFDLSKSITHCFHHSYADDLQLYIHFPVNQFKTYLERSQSDVIGVIQYCKGHNLTMNLSKTQVIIIGTQRYLTQLHETPIPSFIVDGFEVLYSSSVNNLGVLFDPTLSWNDHCISVAKKVFGVLAQLKRNFSYIPSSIRKILVSALVFPLIDYASELFTDMSVVNNLRLQKLQNTCIRFITGAKKCEHVTPYYKELGILKIKERRSLAVSMLMWKVVKDQQPKYLFKSYVFTSSSNLRSTRSNKSMIQVPNHRLEKYHFSFHVQSIKCWNTFKLYDLVQKSPTTVKYHVSKILFSAM